MTRSEFSSVSAGPDDNWYDFAEDVSIVGEKFRLNEGTSFFEAITEAVSRDDEFGVLLEREPNNPHDKLAIKVVGYVNFRHLGRYEYFHVGYIDRKLAFRISNEIGVEDDIFAKLIALEFDKRNPENPINYVINIYEQGEYT
jgi:hypothetical protein